MATKPKTAEEKKVEALTKKLGAVGVTAEASSVEGVDKLTGSETSDELQAVLDKVAPTKDDKNSTVFTFKNGGTRTFSKDVHGAKWEDLADEFQATNLKTIALRDGEQVG